MTAIFILCDVGFLVALFGLSVTSRFSPRARKWFRRFAWVMTVVGVLAVIAQAEYFPRDMIPL